MILLETGSMPPVALIQNADTRTRELLANQAAVHAAIRMQERAVDEARSVLLRQVTAHLKPALQDIVQRIAEGYALARAATADAARLRFSGETASISIACENRLVEMNTRAWSEGTRAKTSRLIIREIWDSATSR